jgi:GxxExxY protein
MMWLDHWSEPVIGAAIEVHRTLGPGLLKSVYEVALCEELRLRKIPFERQKGVPIRYRGLILDPGFRLDLLIGDELILELKSVERIHELHEAQLLTYLRLANKPVGLLINFDVPILKRGIRRFVNNAPR